MFAKTIALLFALDACISVSADTHFHPDMDYHIGDGIQQGSGFRRVQADRNCDAELNAVVNCITLSSCATCLDNAYDAIFENSETVTCGIFQTQMCSAIQDDCTTCSSCEAEAEAFYECLALRGGCSSFQCLSGSPPTTTTPATTTTTTTTTATTSTIAATETDATPEQNSATSGSCGLSDFTNYCQSTHGSSNARAACIIM